MSVHEVIITMCENLDAAGIRVTHKAILERRGGSKRDISRAVRAFHERKQQAKIGTPALPDLPGTLNKDDIIAAADLLTKSETILLFGNPAEYGIKELLILHHHDRDYVKAKLLNYEIVTPENITKSFQVMDDKTILVILLTNSFTEYFDFKKIFKHAVDTGTQVLILQGATFRVPDMPSKCSVLSLDLDVNNTPQFFSIYLQVTLSQIFLTAFGKKILDKD